MTVNGSNGDDNIKVVNSGGSIVVNGLAAQVTIAHADALDSLTINGLGGNDTIDASAIKAGQLANLTINGGDGNDIIIGSAGNDTVYRWARQRRGPYGCRRRHLRLESGRRQRHGRRPGRASTRCCSTAPTSTRTSTSRPMAAACGSRATSPTSPWTSTTSRHIQFNALGGADNITVNDLTGTDVSEVDLNLGGNDGAADTVTLNATNGNDVITITQDANGVITVTGLAEDVKISGMEANDRLVINGLGGDDVITASGLTAGILLTENGGDGDDVLIGAQAMTPCSAATVTTS